MPKNTNKHKPIGAKRVKTDSNITMSLYDMNKQLMKGLPAYSDEKWDEAKETINKFIKKTDNGFYLLYGKEISYFTVFMRSIVDEDFFTALKECVSNVGTVKSIDLMNEDTSIEIWVEPADQEPTMLAFFPYDNGVIKVGA